MKNGIINMKEWVARQEEKEFEEIEQFKAFLWNFPIFWPLLFSELFVRGMLNPESLETRT